MSLVAFYGRKNTRIVKLNTYLNSAKAEDSWYGILFAQKRSLLKKVNFSSSFFMSNYRFFAVASDWKYSSYPQERPLTQDQDPTILALCTAVLWLPKPGNCLMFYLLKAYDVIRPITFITVNNLFQIKENGITINHMGVIANVSCWIIRRKLNNILNLKTQKKCTSRLYTLINMKMKLFLWIYRFN